LADAGRSDEAIDAYRRAYVAWPANDSIRRELGRLVAAHGVESSVDYLKLVANDWPADADVSAYLGEAQLRHGQFRTAVATLRAATDKLPAESPRRDALLSAARTAARLAALEVRIPDLLSGKYTPSSAGGWAQMADVCARTKRYATAARFFRRAAELDEQFSLPAAKFTALAGFGQGTDVVELSEIDRNELRHCALAGFQRLGGIPSDPLLNALKDCVGDLPTDEQVVWRALWISE
jgi:tetratricopeptide (TPR) repeat protein